MFDPQSTRLAAMGRGDERHRRVRLAPALLIACACLLSISQPADSSPQVPMDANRVLWDSVELYGSRFGNSVTVAIHLTRVPASGIEKTFLSSPRGRPFAPSGPEVLLLDVQTRIEPVAISPVTLESRVWFSPREALPLQRFRSRRGEADYNQSFRFTHEGVFRLQQEPRTPAETPLHVDRWSKKDESFYVYPGSRMPTETSLLIYILSAADIGAAGKPLELNVFNRRQFHRVVLQADAPRRLPADLTLRKPGGEVKGLKSVEAVPVRIVSRPLDPNAKEKEDFSFLGLKDEIVLYVEKESRLPVQVSGVIPGIGHVEMRAREIKLQTSKD